MRDQSRIPSRVQFFNMSAPSMDFMIAKEKLSEFTRRAATDGDVAHIQLGYSQLPMSEQDKKMALDQAFRDTLLSQLSAEDIKCSSCTRLIGASVEAVKSELCSGSTPFLMLSDVFDTVVLQKCSEIFCFVEDGVSTWKEEPFYAAGKNYLLRMCNDLLRRLSKSQDTLFCGRIQLFLARLFPLSEKSGLNLMSQFNVENQTHFNTKADEYDKMRKLSTCMDSEQEERMDIEEGEMDESAQSTIPIDYGLYKKFWSLQDYFRKPNQCYEKSAWKAFISYSKDVLECFESYKLEDVKSSRKQSDKHKSKSQQHNYFAKYLTSDKLLDLQLSDSQFRRYVLTQYLVLFQYLHSTSKFKSQSHVLNDDQSSWVKKTTEKVFQLIRETPPDGERYAQAIEHILSREENWSKWKNDGCPNFVKQPVCETTFKAPIPKKRSIGDDLKGSGGKVIKMGNPELTRLWNLNTDNMAACKSQSRDYIPNLEDFFEEAIEQEDPEQMVEDQYKLVNNSIWSWKALRLLARKSPHFFTSQPANKPLKEYLQTMIEKTRKDMVASTSAEQLEASVAEGDMNTEVNEEEDSPQNEDEHQKEEQDSAEKNESAGDSNSATLTKEHIAALAERLGADWKKVATELRFQDDDIEYFASEQNDNEQATKMLTVWTENEDGSVGRMKLALVELGLVDVAVAAFGDANTA